MDDSEEESDTERTNGMNGDTDEDDFDLPEGIFTWLSNNLNFGFPQDINVNKHNNFTKSTMFLFPKSSDCRTYTDLEKMVSCTVCRKNNYPYLVDKYNHNLLRLTHNTYFHVCIAQF